MSSEKKITRHTIESGKQQPFFFLGVVSAEPDYRLSVMLNMHLGSDLRKCNDDIVIHAPSGKQSFSRFSCGNQLFTLVSNRSGGSALIGKLKSIDYILVPGGDHDRKEAELLAASLRRIPEVTAVFLFDSLDNNDKNLSWLIL